MAAPVTVRGYADGDEIGINDLFNRVFSDTRPIREWRRRFVENPALREVDKPDTTIVAETDGTIVGHYSSLLLNMTYKGDIVKAIQVVDTMIDPDGKIGMKTLRKLFLGHLANVGGISMFGFGFPNKTAHVVGKKLFGYIDLTTMVHRFKILSFKGSVRRMFPKASGRILSFVHAASRPIIRVPSIKTNRYILEQADVFDAGADRLWEKIRYRFEITTARTSAYLNWRYKDQGAVFLFARCGEEISGYAILKIETDKAGIQVGKILDIIYDEDAAASFLLCSSLEYFIANSADCALCGCLPGTPLEKQLGKAGFVERKGIDPIPVVWLPFTEDLDRDYISDPGNWHLVYGDIDGF